MMNAEEIGIYMMLLFLDWKDDGFEFEPRKLSRLCQTTKPKFLRAWELVGQCFAEHDGRWWNERLKREREKQAAWRSKSTSGGRASANQRATKGQPTPQPTGNQGATNDPTKGQPTGNTLSSSSSSTLSTSSLQQRDETRKPRESSSDHSTWLTPAGTAYEAAFGVGSFDYGKAARLLAPLHKAGHDPEAIGRHLAWYIAARGDEYAHEKDDKLTIGVRGWVPNLKSFQMTYERWNPIVPDEAAA